MSHHITNSPTRRNMPHIIHSVIWFFRTSLLSCSCISPSASHLSTRCPDIVDKLCKLWFSIHYSHVIRYLDDGTTRKLILKCNLNVKWYRGTTGSVRLAIKSSMVRLSARVPTDSYLTQVIQDYVALSLSSKIWYWLKGSDALRWKVTTYLAESNDSLPPGLWHIICGLAA